MKDFLGKELIIGDIVVHTALRGPEGIFVKAKIISFTPKK